MKRLLWIILICALFFRVYRVSELTGFYYDQGRDALVIWNLWHSHKPFLIGPTTGIEGIFLGPFYYYLIAPFYLLGNGNPVFPALALAVINVIGIYVVYLIGEKFFHPLTGILAAFFLAFSFPLVAAHRWLSNPTPLPLFSALAVLFLLRLTTQNKHGLTWLFLGLCLGLSLQLEAASAVFFLPATLLILFLFRRQVIWGIGWLHALFGFCLTLIPQLWFNFRHDNLLIDAFAKFLVADKSFAPVLSDFYPQRLLFYFDSFFQKFFYDRGWAVFFGVFLLLVGIIYRKKVFTKSANVLLIWIVTPLIALLFYHGNHGYIWNYYFTGVYSLFVLLVAWIITQTFLFKTPLFHLLSGLFILAFIITNQSLVFRNLSAPLTADTAINLGTSKAAVDWIYADAAGRQFNVDVYVPPVVPYAYDYLFLWRGQTRYHTAPAVGRTSLLYLLYESDPSHPERLTAWLDRQAGIAESVTAVGFGGVTVERRERLNP
jgi:4-amino-4-deoxy-L-arabinose transferase-like glycosyltransferase